MKAIIIFTLVINIVFSQDYCLRFFGNGTNDIDRVKIDITQSGKLINIGGDFTIEFEIKAKLSDNPLGSSATTGSNDDWTLGHIIIDRDIFGEGDYGDFGISLANGRVAFGVNKGNNSYTLITSQQIPDNQWVWVAVTRNSTNGNMAIFINGEKKAECNNGPTGNISYNIGRTTSWPNSDPYLVIAAEKHDYDNNNYPSFRGHIDNLRISNVVRYTSDYTPTTINADNNTVAFYDFNEGGGNILYDKATISTVKSDGQIKYGGFPYGPIWILRNTNFDQTIFNNKNDFIANLSSNYFTNDFNSYADYTSNPTNNIIGSGGTPNVQYTIKNQNGLGIFPKVGYKTIRNWQPYDTLKIIFSSSNVFYAGFDVFLTDNNGNRLTGQIFVSYKTSSKAIHSLNSTTSGDYPFTGFYSPVKIDTVLIYSPANALINLTNLITSVEGVLAVDFLSVVAYSLNNKNVIEWETTNEYEILMYEVERFSYATNSWQTIGVVKPYRNNYNLYTFSDHELSYGRSKYRIKQVDLHGNFIFSDEIEINNQLPKNLLLLPNYPNPFNPYTYLRFILPEPDIVYFNIYSSTGALIYTSQKYFLQQGYNQLKFDVTGLVSGIYYYQIITTKNNKISKMLLLK